MTLDRAYITPEIAKLLKEVSYNYETEKVWEGKIDNKFKLLWKDVIDDQLLKDFEEYYFPAPEQWEVQKWLRNLHDLHIVIHAIPNEKTLYYEAIIQNLQNKVMLIHLGCEGVYEDLLMLAIGRCLEIVKDKQDKTKQNGIIPTQS